MKEEVVIKIRVMDFKPASISYNFRTIKRQIKASTASKIFV
jgi:hypothetical protein